MIGAKLAHYSILERIGTGGMGEVYKAFDPRLARMCALKVLNPSAVADEIKRMRFVQEALAASALNHPNIITIYEIGQEDKYHYIAAEYIEGETLRLKIKRGPLSIEAAIDIALQVAKALGAAHQAGVIHRDVKPENIMIRPDGYVKMLDFGLAKLIEPAADAGDASSESGLRSRRQLIRTAGNVVVGTVRYMSPEQIQGLSIDCRSDIFSFGILLYEMLAGRLPFSGATALDAAREIIAAAPRSMGNFIAGPALELQPFVNKCLEKSPEARHQDAQALLRELGEIKRRIELGIVGRGRETEKLSEKGFSGRRLSIAVVGFENLTADPQFAWWRSALAELLAIRLSSNNRFEVLSGERVCEQLAALGRRFDQEIDKETALEVSRKAEVEICLRGSFTILAGGASASAHLLDAASGGVIASVAVKKARSDDLPSLADELASNIEKALDIASDKARMKPAAEGWGSADALKTYAEGLEFFRLGAMEAAKESFERALESAPESALVRYRLAMIERERGEGRRRLDEALEKADRLGGRERSLLRMEAAALEGDPTRLKGLAEEFVLNYPREKYGYLFLGDAHRELGECERAFIVFQQALAISPQSLFRNERKGAFGVFESYLENGCFESAEDAARRAAAKNPELPAAHQMLGTALFYQKRYGEALEAFEQAASAGATTCSDLYSAIWMARIQITEGKCDRAEEELRIALEGREGVERRAVLIELADAMRERGRLRQWFKILSREKELFADRDEAPFDPSFGPRFWRGYFFERVGELKKAVLEYERALAEIDGERRTANGERGRDGERRAANVRTANGERESGERENNADLAPSSMQSADFPFAVRRSPFAEMESAWAHVHLGRMLAACGYFERAGEIVEQLKTIALHAANPKTDRLRQLLSGEIAFYMGDYKSSAKLLESSIWSYYGGCTLAALRLAQSFRQLKQYERALELLEWTQPYGTAQGCDRFCLRAELELEAAKTYEAAGDRIRAAERYEKCLKIWETADDDYVGRQEAIAGYGYLIR